MGEGEEGEEKFVDPLRDYADFVLMRDQVRFLRTLPRRELRQLMREVPAGGSFAAILRNVIAVLALDRQQLVVTPELAKQFQQECFADGRMVQEVREKVLDLAGQHLAAAVGGEAVRGRLGAAVVAEIEELEKASGGDLGELLLVSYEEE
tara:strand:- start:113 stop:562 length:450 start_codon:yes stop_codon:yes gene_type:complete